MKYKELSVDLYDKTVTMNRSEGGYKNISKVLRVPRSKVASKVLKSKCLEPAGLFHLGGDQEPYRLFNGALEVLCRDGRTYQKDGHLSNTSSNYNYVCSSG